MLAELSLSESEGIMHTAPAQHYAHPGHYAHGACPALDFLPAIHASHAAPEVDDWPAGQFPHVPPALESVYMYAYTFKYARVWVYICTRVGAFCLFVLSNLSTTCACITGVS